MINHLISLDKCTQPPYLAILQNVIAFMNPQRLYVTLLMQSQHNNQPMCCYIWNIFPEFNFLAIRGKLSRADPSLVMKQRLWNEEPKTVGGNL